MKNFLINCKDKNKTCDKIIELKKYFFYYERMRSYIPHNDLNLVGSILVATPDLIDPSFRRTILFIMQNDNSTGSMAVIINRPTGTCLSDIDDTTPSHLADVPVFLGGPIEANHLIIARIIQVSSNIGFRSIAQEENNIPSNEMWAFFGYAGWKVGQLEQEISAKAWLLIKARPEFFLITQTQEDGILQWKSIMKQSGPWFHLLSSIPDDVTLN